ncbi:Arylsulfotransferase-domain-containing protein [Xylaria bambusicola]|uniref:Arylsulfotransferase-domain-containing protein n=1 Tax=Xylaria bambusicola TaxID=326684 RepID=UPI00200807B5|nr:Arylsulfotransferase-domain-containing protein [Xylaria bambusicola]KAI0518185.1 Arylsulfotransferase-domain-containing protein [Xylaria bambusicola]
MQRFIWTTITASAGVMISPTIADADLVYDSKGYNSGKYGPNPHQHYFSTDITSPLLLVNYWDPTRTENSSYIFLTLDSPGDGRSTGPVIYRADDLSLVYSDLHWSAAHNSHIDQFNGKDYLVFIEQFGLGGGPSASCLLYDSTYSLAYNISSHGYENTSIGLHECQLTSDGSAVVILKAIISFDLTAVGGPEDGDIIDNIVQEVDIETGELLWLWRGSEHYNISDSYIEYKDGNGPYDYIHMNSADKTSKGDFLISARHTHSITLVDGEHGSIKWTLGGKRNEFLDISPTGNATDFAWQHHARLTDDSHTRLTMFDNHNITGIVGCTTNCSRGKRIELDYEHRTAELVSEFYHPQSLVSRFEGSYQTTRSGNVFIGWGANPTFTEHTPSGLCVLDVQFNIWRPEKGYPVNYRAFKMDWKAHPTWDPDMVALGGETDGQFKIYVSWNGATEVARWQLIVGDSYDNVTDSAIVVPRAGFETEILLKLHQPFIRAAALDKDDSVLGMTAILQLVLDGELANGS